MVQKYPKIYKSWDWFWSFLQKWDPWCWKNQSGFSGPKEGISGSNLNYLWKTATLRRLEVDDSCSIRSALLWGVWPCFRSYSPQVDFSCQLGPWSTWSLASLVHGQLGLLTACSVASLVSCQLGRRWTLQFLSGFGIRCYTRGLIGGSPRRRRQSESVKEEEPLLLFCADNQICMISGATSDIAANIKNMLKWIESSKMSETLYRKCW